LPIHLAKGSNLVAYGLVNPTYGSYPKQELVIQSEKEAINKNLIVCVLSVSTYLDETKSLTYAVKDGQDVLNMMNQQKAEYDTVITHTLYNKDVTLIKIDSMFRNISATEHDKVVFFLSGHGLLDDDLNFYFATYDIDFKNPKGKGLPFSTLQRYISNFTSPQELLLIDACQSGLADASKRLKDTSPSKPGITPIREHSFTGKGAEEMVSENEITLQNSFVLMRELFSDLSSNSGVETITAASGDSWALESSQWKNGAFTFVLKKALINFEADENKDGIISIKELKNYLLTEVEILTNGAQRATSRSANKGISWNIWE